MTGYMPEAVPFVGGMNDRTMTMLAATLHDALALAVVAGPETVLGIGTQAGDVDIIAPSAYVLSATEAAASIKYGREKLFFAFGGHKTARIAAIAAPVIDHLSASTGAGFMAVCLADPLAGRTIYQGHLFENGSLRENLLQSFSLALAGSVGHVSHQIVASGASAIRRQCGALKEQGKTLAIIDAINQDNCATIAQSLEFLPLTGGSTWLLPRRPQILEPPPPCGPVSILSGALARQTVYQIGAARNTLPVFDLDFANPDPVAHALAWASPKIGAPLIITSSVPPDKVTAGAPAAAMLGRIAQGLATAGITRFIITGNATASAILAALGISRLTKGAAFGPLRWMQDETLSLCIKPGEFGPGNLFLHEFEPQIRLNAAVELAP